MTANIALTTFNSGELSPKLDARSDIEKYAAGCRTLENMLPTIYGGVERRPGTQYINATKDNGNVRLIPFIFSSDIAYICEFGDGYIRFYFDGAILTDPGGTIVEVSTPYLSAHLPALQFVQLGDTMWLTHNSYAPRKLTRTTATSFSLDEIVFNKGPFMTRNDLANPETTDPHYGVTMTYAGTLTKGATGTLTASASYFTSDHVGSLFSLTHPRTDNVAGVTKIVAAGASSDALDVKGTWTFLTQGTWEGTVYLQRQEDPSLAFPADGWEIYRAFVGVAANFSLSGVEEEDNVRYRIHVEAYTSGAITASITANESTWEGIVRVTSVLSPTIANVTVVKRVQITATATKRWAEGSWNRGNGYPAAVAFYEDRIIYAGTTAEPQTVWLSEVDDYEDFEAGVNDADSFSLVLTTTNEIRWAEGLDALIFGTSGDEWAVTSNKIYTPLSPTNFAARRQTTWGSAARQPVRFRKSILFLDKVQRKVREFTYRADLQEDEYVAPDMTALADHISEGGITSFAFQKHPDPILWCVRTDGTLLSLTYDREQNVIAWARHIVGTESHETTSMVQNDDTPITDYIEVLAGCGTSNDGVLLLSTTYQQVRHVGGTTEPPYTFVYHAHKGTDGYIYTGSGEDASLIAKPYKFDANLTRVADWPADTTWPTSAGAETVYSARPTHDDDYVYCTSLRFADSTGRITKLTADTGALVWRVSTVLAAWDVGILSDGNVIAPVYEIQSSCYFPAILSGTDGSVVHAYYDGTIANRCVPAAYRVLVREDLGLWFTCGVRDAGASTSRGIVQAFNLGDDYYLTRAWNFDPTSGASDVVRGIAYKDGYIYAVGDQATYGGTNVSIWKIHATTGLLAATGDLGFSLQDVFVKNDGTIVVVRKNSMTDTWTEINETTLAAVNQYDADATPNTDYTIWRAEQVPEALLNGGYTSTTTTTTASGSVQSVAVIPGEDEDEVWVVVGRTIGGSAVRYIERMKPRDFGDLEDAYFVDAGVWYDGAEATTITGLTHLEGQEVAILGDGAVFPNQTVASGAVTLSHGVTKCAVGLPFRYILKPMRIDTRTAKGDSMGSYKRIAELKVSFFESGNAKYGKDTSHLFDFEWRTTEAYGSPPALATEQKTAVLDGGFDPEDPIVISDDGPLPCTVRAIVAAVDVTGR